MKQRLEKLEKDNEFLNKSVMDLKQVMRDNLLYYNLPKTKDENATKIVLKLIEEKVQRRNKQDQN